MKHQESLDFRGDRLAAVAIYKQLPPASRKQAVALWAQLIGLAAQRRPNPNPKGAKDEPATR